MPATVPTLTDVVAPPEREARALRSLHSESAPPRRVAPRGSELPSLAVGALALGALAFGALAIGRLAIALLAVRRARIHRLRIDDLDIGNLHLDAPHAPLQSR